MSIIILDSSLYKDIYGMLSAQWALTSSVLVPLLTTWVLQESVLKDDLEPLLSLFDLEVN